MVSHTSPTSIANSNSPMGRAKERGICHFAQMETCSGASAQTERTMKTSGLVHSLGNPDHLDSFSNWRYQIQLSPTVSDKVVVSNRTETSLGLLPRLLFVHWSYLGMGINVAMLAKGSTFHHTQPLCPLFETSLIKLM